ncbi:universal stress protein [Acinetobacter sp. ANC 4648]|uniref:universal stress protein n=1 Tax=Acinetobacter sp. ANC 4648 TaxID=1977875 RepID=UPI000A345D44|nr:universal stress protein [Acinetobacter sp. ANC 4648]OTG82288.1 universal stress protein [Acinetobacter sp. ANC 4648]
MHYQHLLVAVDDSDVSLAAAEEALILAKVLKCKVTLVSVVSLDPLSNTSFYGKALSATDYYSEAVAHAKNTLSTLKLKFTNAGISTDAKILGNMAESHAITQLANELNVDLIVMGSHGRTGFKKIALGSVAQDVLTLSHVPVLIIKHTQ